MAEPFNIEQYRQQMRGETPQIEPQIQAQQLAPQQMPANPVASHPQPSHAQMPHVQAPQTQPRHMAQQPAHMQPQHQMPQAPAFTPQPNMAPAPQAPPAQNQQETGKKSLFNFKRGSKLKAPKIKTAKTDTVQAATTSPLKTFIFGMVCGILCCFIGSMIL